MKKELFAVAASMLLALPVGAAPPPAAAAAKPLGEVETAWPGVHYQVTVLKRIPPGRLLAVIRIVATAKTPLPGIKLSEPNPATPPPGISPQHAAYLFPAEPFSLKSTVMTDELSQQKYPALSPVAPPGRAYRAGEVLTFLRPKDSVVLTLQFSIPPPPPPPPAGTVPPKQTISFLFPKALGPMSHLVLPAPANPAGATP